VETPGSAFFYDAKLLKSQDKFSALYWHCFKIYLGVTGIIPDGIPDMPGMPGNPDGIPG
jgi:hypothetical protein